jgi:sigma-E factor negative regulatory protein RseA
MNMNHMTQEQISAFADGELDGSRMDGAMAALRLPEGQAAWDIYHHIGDALRSEEMAFTLSPNFAARMTARLEAEPAIVAPKTIQTPPEQLPGVEAPAATRGSMKRFAITGGAVFAVAAIALISSPQLMVATKDRVSPTNMATMTASSGRVAEPFAVGPSNTLPVVAAAGGTGYGAVVLRDPRIDEYLLAHQRFSPSLYSTAQYARSATFATDSDK